METKIAPQQKHNRRETIVLVVILLLLLIGVGFGLLTALREQPLTIQKQAQSLRAPICPDEGATCSWSPAGESGISYKYVILDVTTNQKVDDGTITSTRVSFTPIVDHTYRCTVIAVNACGEGSEASATNTCVGVGTPTPTTPEEKPTPTPPDDEKPTPTPTEEPTETLTPTDEVEPTPTEEPTTTIVVEESPEKPGVVVVTNPPTEETVIVQVQPTEIPSPIPTRTPPPQAGANTGMLFMIVSTLILVTLMLVF